MKVFVDTNIIIDYTKGFGKELFDLLEKQEKKEVEIFINPIVVAEFFNDKNLKNNKKLETALELFENFQVIDIDKKIGLIAGELLRENKVGFLADALIAATCLKNSLFLFTKNRVDFKKVKQLKFY